MAHSQLADAVVDASVAVKWVMAEANAEVALQLLEGGIGVSAPAHWLSEAANALWAAAPRGDLIGHEAHERAATLSEAPIRTVPLNEWVSAAMVIAIRLDITIYDALYLALAEQRAAVLVTDDRRLLAAARGDKQLRERVMRIGDRSVPRLFRQQ